MKTVPMANEQHLLNSKLANAGMKPGPGAWEARALRVTLEQNAGGAWLVRINGGLAFPATDVEVSLWLSLQSALTTGTGRK